MATAAFKSTTSRRGSTTSTSNSNSNSNSTKVVPSSRRRSLSVSALSREKPELFSNKIDNPLFSTSPPHKQISLPENSVKSPPKTSGLTPTTSERGRSVKRDSASGTKHGIGRSLSRVRCRSASRGPSQSETEQEELLTNLSNHRSRNDPNIAATNGLSRVKSPRVPSVQHPAVESSDESTLPSRSTFPTPIWDDGISTGSLSEAEEKTIKAVYEQVKSLEGDDLGNDTAKSGIYETVQSEVRRAISQIQHDIESAIRRNNTTAIATTNIADIPPDLVNPGAVELVLDIRRDYARKLEESRERARKLRADLAVEEHRGQELNRILREIVPDPKTSIAQRSRPGRRISSERKKMSKRLTDEAMAYFDECVSISTFDSSDFSAPEDPPLDSVGVTFPVGGTASLAQGSPSISTSYCRKSFLNHKQESGGHGCKLMDSPENYCITANSSSNDRMMMMMDEASERSNNSERSRKLELCLGNYRTNEIVGVEKGIRSYIRCFEKDIDNDDDDDDDMNNLERRSIRRSNYYDVDEYNNSLKGGECTESLLFDRVLFFNRIESGSLHICGGGGAGGGIAQSFSPFASII